MFDSDDAPVWIGETTQPDVVWPQHEAAIARGARCKQCPLYGCGRGPVPSQLEPGGLMVVSGEAPGENEVLHGWNFVGVSGQMLDDALAAGGVPRSRISAINVLACMPEGGQSLDVFLERTKRRTERDGKEWHSPIDCCRPRFERDIEDSLFGALDPVTAASDPRKLPIMLAVGQYALTGFERWAKARQFYAGDELQMSKVHGAPIPLTIPPPPQVEDPAAGADYDQAFTDIPGAEPAGASVAFARGGEGARTWGYMLASYHPAFAVADRGGLKWRRFVEANITRAAAIARRGYIMWSEPDYLLAPPVTVALEWLDHMTRRAHQMRAAGLVPEAVLDLETCESDIEGKLKGRPSVNQHTCAIRTIGVMVSVPVAESNQPATDPTGTLTEYVLVIPFRHMNGDLWEYSDEDRLRLAIAFRLFFDVHELIGHNAYPFDTAIMLRGVDETLNVQVPAAIDPSAWARILSSFGDFAGMASGVVSTQAPSVSSRGNDSGILFSLLGDKQRNITDTQTLHHCTPSQDMSHGLSFAGREFFEVPAWKSKEDIASTDNADDDKLLLRCARDNRVTGIITPVMREWNAASYMLKQYETDTDIGRILRNMSELGMVIDEQERGFWSRNLGREHEKLLREWYELCGSEVNPQSPDQLQDLLYRKWGYDPPIVKDSLGGIEWEDELHDIEDGATSVNAILALLDRGVAPLHAQALEKLLETKALAKPKGSYVDNTPTVPFPDGDYGMVPAEGALPERARYSWIRPTFSISKTPVGRSVCKKPGEQQRPKQGRKLYVTDYYGNIVRDKDGKPRLVTANMRKIIVAAPGHVFVYADYMQSHVRIYGALAQSERIYRAVKEGIDIHAMNGAALLTDNEADLWKAYEWILSGKDADAPNHADYEYWRFVPKKYFFGVAYGAIWETLYETLRGLRKPADGKRAFPGLTENDCRVWHERIHRHYPEMAPWQQSELAQYLLTGRATSPILDERTRWGPLEDNQKPNHSVLAFEGSQKNRAMKEIDAACPHRKWSKWSGLVLDYHDALVLQVPESRAEEGVKIVEGAMAFKWRDMPFGGKAAIVRSLGDA